MKPARSLHALLAAALLAVAAALPVHAAAPAAARPQSQVFYQIFFRSFRFNSRVAINVEGVFCEAYGLDHLDNSKLDYYGLLDDLF